MKTISLVMIVKNEEQNIQRCLDSVKDLVHEIIVVDTGSTDRTKEIALANGASLFSYEWDDNFSNARNFALEQATSDWCLILDADEYIISCNKQQIQQFLKHEVAIGQLKIINLFKDDRGDAQAISYISRLLPRNVRYFGRIHEQPDLSVVRKRIEIDIMHDGYYDKNKAYRNIPLLQKELELERNNGYLHYQIAKEYRGLKQYEQSYDHLRLSFQLTSKNERQFGNVVVDYLYAMMSSKRLDDGLEVIDASSTQLYDFSDFHFVSGLFLLELMLDNPEKYIYLLPRIEECYKRCLVIGEQSKYDTVLGTGSFSALHNLGVYYEVLGRTTDARQCYQQAADMGYNLSIERLHLLLEG